MRCFALSKNGSGFKPGEFFQDINVKELEHG